MAEDDYRTTGSRGSSPPQQQRTRASLGNKLNYKNDYFLQINMISPISIFSILNLYNLCLDGTVETVMLYTIEVAT